MNKLDEQIDYWKKSAERNWDTALSLFKSKHYDACLFFCHLTIEKLLKGLVVIKTKKTAPYIHHLEKLANIAQLVLSDEKIKNLRIITGFNMSGRYEDSKFAFYKQCTKDYTEKYLNISKDLIIWLKKKYLKN